MYLARCQHLISSSELERCRILMINGYETIPENKAKLPHPLDSEECTHVLGELLVWIALKLEVSKTKSKLLHNQRSGSTI